MRRSKASAMPVLGFPLAASRNTKRNPASSAHSCSACCERLAVRLDFHTGPRMVFHALNAASVLILLPWTCGLTFEFTRSRRLAKPAVASRVQRRVRRTHSGATLLHVLQPLLQQRRERGRH